MTLSRQNASDTNHPAIKLWGAPTLEPRTWNEPLSTPDRIVTEPWSISTARFKSTTTSVWDFHTHHEHELLWSAGGTVTLEASEHLWMVPPMLGIWIPAGTAHRVRSDDGAVIFATYLTPDHIDADWASIVGIPMTGALREALLHNENNAMPDPKRPGLQQVAIDLIHPIQAASLDIPMPRTPDLLSIAQQIINEPADDRTTADWARTIGVSGRTLMRRFHAHTGTTLTQWRILVRVRSGWPSSTPARLSSSHSSPTTRSSLSITMSPAIWRLGFLQAPATLAAFSARKTFSPTIRTWS